MKQNKFFEDLKEGLSAAIELERDQDQADPDNSQLISERAQRNQPSQNELDREAAKKYASGAYGTLLGEGSLAEAFEDGIQHERERMAEVVKALEKVAALNSASGYISAEVSYLSTLCKEILIKFKGETK